MAKFMENRLLSIIYFCGYGIIAVAPNMIIFKTGGLVVLLAYLLPILTNGIKNYPIRNPFIMLTDGFMLFLMLSGIASSNLLAMWYFVSLMFGSHEAFNVKYLIPYRAYKVLKEE